MTEWKWVIIDGDRYEVVRLETDWIGDKDGRQRFYEACQR